MTSMDALMRTAFVEVVIFPVAVGVPLRGCLQASEWPRGQVLPAEGPEPLRAAHSLSFSQCARQPRDPPCEAKKSDDTSFEPLLPEPRCQRDAFIAPVAAAKPSGPTHPRELD